MLTGLFLITSQSLIAQTEEEFNSRLDEINAWGSIEGTWTGSYIVDSAPEHYRELLKQQGVTDSTYELRVVLAEGAAPTVAIQFDKKEGFLPLEGDVRIIPEALGWNISIRREGGVWIERYNLFFARVAEKEAALTFTRTVHNWLTAEKDRDKTFYHVFGVGKMTLQDTGTSP